MGAQGSCTEPALHGGNAAAGCKSREPWSGRGVEGSRRRHAAHRTGSHVTKAACTIDVHARESLGEAVARVEACGIARLTPRQRCLAAAILAADRQNQGKSTDMAGECQAKLPGTK